MFIFLSLLPLVLASSPSTHIIGGTRVTDQQRHPWQGSLQYLGGHVCGCVLLTSDYALTAAHCTDGRDKFNFEMRFNSLRWRAGGILYWVMEIIPHPDYDDGSGGVVPHDMCVLRSGESITGVAVSLDSSQSDSDCWISGWGDDIYAGEGTMVLHEADINIMTHEECKAILGTSIRADVHICITSDNRDKGACHGDSGGPLVCNHGGTSPELRGITSFGHFSCDHVYPSVYARIYNTDNGVNLKDWICKTVPGAGGC